jgi:hypothetical protein
VNDEPREINAMVAHTGAIGSAVAQLDPPRL